MKQAGSVALALLLSTGVSPVVAERAKQTLVSPGVPSTMVEDLGRREYVFSPAEGGAWTAPNRAGNLRALVSLDGVEVISRTRGADGFRLALELVAYGRRGCVESVRQAPPLAIDNRVEIARPGMVEWYVNDVRGLEQGFDLAWGPECEASAAPVVLEMRMETTLHARLTDGGRSIEFRRAGGGLGVLRYADLLVLDATGRSLPGRLRIGDDRLSIEVDDRDAVYPLRVDPLMTEIGWEVESDQGEAFLGLAAVAAAGDVNGDGFDDVIVGADEWDGGLVNQGKAWVYHGSATGLSVTPDWEEEGSQDRGHFGGWVSPAGDVNGDGYDDVLVTAMWEDELFPFPTANAGYVYLYLGSPTGLEADPAWQRVGGPGCELLSAGTNFGCIVAFRPAHGDFNGDGYSDILINNWAQLETPSDYGQGLLFDGSAGGLSDDYSWHWEDDIPDEFSVVNSAGDVNGDGYDDIVAGNPDYSNGEFEEGQVLIFLGSASGVSQNPSWTYETNIAGAHLGHPQEPGWGMTGPSGLGDIDGDGFGDIIASAPDYTDGVQAQEGAVFVWLGSAFGPQNPPKILEGNQGAGDGNPAWLGWIADPVGDVNGDGLDDLVVGSPTYDSGQVDNGEYRVYHGPLAGVAPTPSWTLSGPDPGPFANIWSATGAGDVNGDGYDDLIAGWGYWDGPELNEGRATVWYGFCDGDDLDGDGRCTGVPTFDCDDGNGGIWSTPGEVVDLLFTDRTTLSWSVPEEPGALSVVYDTLRSSSSADFSAASCVESNDGSDTVVTVADDPSPGQLHSFLVRAENDCPAGQGSLGSDSAGAPRSGVSCP